MGDYSRYRVLKVERDAKVALVTLNRPESLNCFTEDLHLEMKDVLEDLASDEEVNVVVLTGAGRAFSAGGDLKKLQAKLKEPGIPPHHNSYRLIDNLLNLEKPIIAAVNGHAVGAGATIALFCDAVFASETAIFRDPHVSIGLVAGDGSCVIWPLLVGVAKAKQYLLTGDPIDAREAERIGLITKAVPEGEAVMTAMAFARRLADGPTMAINGTKTAINLLLKQNMNLILRMSLAYERLCHHTEDHHEAVNAFVEKRQPKFRGR